MKGKLKFDLGSIQGLLVRNVEKIVFSVVILVLVLFVHRAFSREKYRTTPEQLDQVVASANAKLENGLEDVGPPPTNYSELAKREQLSPEHYKLDAIWNPPLFPQRGKRDQPLHFPVEDLRVAAGHGAMAAASTSYGSGAGTGSEEPSGMMGMGGTGGTGGRKGFRWVVVTGLIDYQRQLEAYEEKFEEALFRDPQRDQPRYFAFKVQRAEISNPNRPGALNWKSISARASLRLIAPMGGGSMEGPSGYLGGGGGGGSDVHPHHFVPVAKAGKYTLPLTFPLPSVSNHIWRDEICHLPEIPVMRDLERAKPRTSDDMDEPDMDALPDDPMASAPGAGSMRGGMGMGYGYGSSGMGAEEGMDGYLDDGGGPMSGYGMSGSGAVELTEEQLKYKLFRFFDFDVEPGKHYRYRVALLLWNPNYKVEPQYLLSSDLGKSWYVETEYSEASDTITVLRDSEVLAGPVDPPIRVRPLAKVGILRFMVDTGTETFAEYQVARGQLLNFHDHVLSTKPSMSGYDLMSGSGYEDYEEDGMMGDYGSMLGLGGPGMAGPSGRGSGRSRKKKDEEEEGEKIDLLTETMLLDLRGGSKLPGRDRDMMEPGRILLLDAAGRLEVRYELDDEELYHVHKPPEKKTPARGAMPYEGEDDGMMLDGMMGGYEEDYGGRRGRGRRGRGEYEE
jgi:hypothetical protein